MVFFSIKILNRKLYKFFKIKINLWIESMLIIHFINPKSLFKKRVNNLFRRINEHGFGEYDLEKFSLQNYSRTRI